MADEAPPPPEPTRAYGARPPPVPVPGEPRIGESLDDFLLVDRLGAGAFATVFLAHQTSMRRTVALKVAESGGTEAQTLAQLDHPGVVRVYDERNVPDRGVHLVYMEYVPGGTLEAVVRRVRDGDAATRSGTLLLEVVDAVLARRGLDAPSDSLLRRQYERSSWPEAVARLGAQLAEALDYAHGQGVLHRDVKPGNVLLGANARARLADFNVSSAREVESEVSPHESLGGSIAYMPPEQLEACSETHPRRADALDGRSDLYALGVLLWELLSGHRPLPTGPDPDDTEGDVLEALARARRGPWRPAPDAALPADTPRLLEEALRACLAPEPADRPPSGRHLARRLTLALDPRVRELLVPPSRRWKRAARRFPLLALLVAGLAPNVVLSALNILWNLQVAAGGRWESFLAQVSVINGVMYAVGIALGLVWMWPLLEATRRRRRGETLAAEDRAHVRRRGVVLGDRLAALLVVLWSVSGVLFALWQAAQEGGAVSGEVTFHFTLSMLLFGILAATLCFFGVNHMLAGALLPSFVEPGDEDPQAAEGLERLGRRTWLYFAGCTAVPFLAIIALALQPLGHRTVFLALGVLGVLGFAVAFWFGAEIRRDLEAMARALR